MLELDDHDRNHRRRLHALLADAEKPPEKLTLLDLAPLVERVRGAVDAAREVPVVARRRSVATLKRLGLRLLRPILHESLRAQTDFNVKLLDVLTAIDENQRRLQKAVDQLIEEADKPRT